jgi:hypothetical protein
MAVDVLFIVGAAHETTRRFTALPQVAAQALHAPAFQSYTQSRTEQASTAAG